MELERRRTSISVPKVEYARGYRLQNEATGEIHECADLAALLRIISTHAATSDTFNLKIAKEKW